MVAVENIEKSTSRAVELSSIKHSWIKVVSPGSHCLLLQGGLAKVRTLRGVPRKVLLRGRVENVNFRAYVLYGRPVKAQNLTTVCHAADSLR